MSGLASAETLDIPTCRGPAPTLARIEIDPLAVEKDLSRLVLTLIEFLRRLMEAQAVRRMEAGTISDAQTEALGSTLMASRGAILSLCARLDIDPLSLNLDLGPLGPLL